MTIYLLYITIMFVLGLILNYQNNTKQRNFLIIVGFLGLFLIASLRSEVVGKDIWNYLNIFDKSQNINWIEVFNYYEPGIYILNKLILLFTNDTQIYLSIISGIILLGPLYLIWKYSKNPAMSYIIYVTMVFFALSLSGLRFALGITAILFSYNYIVQKKPIKFILLVLIATIFHKTLIIFLVAYPLGLIKITKKNIPFYIMFFIFVFIFKESLLSFFVDNFFDKYEYSLSKSLSVNYLLFMISILLIAFLFYKKLDKQNANSSIQYNLLILGNFIQIFAMESSGIARLAQAFYIFILLLIPDIIESIEEKRLKVFGYTICFFAFLLLFIFVFNGGGYGTVPYIFYWQ